VSKPIPTLEAVWAALIGSRAHGWDQGTAKDRLRAAGASWTRSGLVSCPEKERANLISDFTHHETWRHDRKRFCAELRALNVSYEEVGAACDEMGLIRPSMATAAEREVLLRDFEFGGGMAAIIQILRADKLAKGPS